MKKKKRGRPGPALTYGVPLLIALGIGVVGYRYLERPKSSEHALLAAKQEVVSSPVTIRVTGDPWSGYSTFRGEPRLKAALAKDRITLEYLADEKYYDQNERMRALGTGELDLALTTLDAFLQHGAKHKQHGQYPGVILFGVDESAGGDAIFLAKGRNSFDEVKASDRVCFAEGTPSEHLWDFASLSFATLESGLEKKLGVVAEDCWKKLRAEEVQIAVLWQPFTAIAEKAGYKKVFATGGQADDVILDILVANRDFVSKQRPAIQKLTAAYFETIASYGRDVAAHAGFVTSDCGPDCAGDQTLGRAVLSGIDFLTTEENLCLWFGQCGKPNKLIPRIGKTGKLLTAKNKLSAADLPDPVSIVDDSFLLALKGDRQERADLAREVAGPDADPNALPAVAVEEVRYDYMVPGAEDTPRDLGIGTLTLPRVFFPEGSYRLDENAESVVTVIADKLKSFPALCVRVTGYTNSKGDPAANKQLSKLRALVITQHLTRLDPLAFPSNRFLVKGMGAAQPILTSGSEDSRASRRTEFTLFDCAGSKPPAQPKN
jgi:outer membrane protein OmpA-like peptidoglycan-associated protein